MSRKEWRTKKIWGNRPRNCSCGAYGKILHHIDRDYTNDVVENILPLCRACHINEHRSEIDSHTRVLKVWESRSGRSIEETKLLCKTAITLVTVCGLSTREVAKRTGPSKSYVHYLVKQYNNDAKGL